MTPRDVQPLDPVDDAGIALVAQRMRATLEEVLGAERGHAMYSLDWLQQRVRWHLDPEHCTGAVFLATDTAGVVVGHTIVRVETALSSTGLFSSTYVVPAARRGGVAALLLDRGERWMRDHRLTRAATNTAATNGPLISLYQDRGYRIVLAEGEMVRLSRTLVPGT